MATFYRVSSRFGVANFSEFFYLPTVRKGLVLPMNKDRLFWLPLLSVILMFLLPGCATPTRSFNQDYNEDYPPQPRYVIDQMDDTRFKIRLYQGTPMPDQLPVAVDYMKQAVWVIANTEGRRRGWQRWEVNYIQERNQGWMHVLVAVVIRDK